jgi:hypothetical protein
VGAVRIPHQKKELGLSLNEMVANLPADGWGVLLGCQDFDGATLLLAMRFPLLEARLQERGSNNKDLRAREEGRCQQ